MRTHPALPLLGVALLTAACSAAPAPSTSQPSVSGPMRTGHVAPTRSEEECRPLVDSVTAHPDRFQVPEARLREIRLPPLDDVPPRLRGTTFLVSAKVDAHGVVLPDSTTFDPMIGDARYEQRLRKVVSEWRFSPAVLQGCAVPSRSANHLTMEARH